MKRYMTILFLILVAGIFASCGAGNGIPGTGLNIGNQEFEGETTERDAEGDGEGGVAVQGEDNEQDAMTAGTRGKVFNLQDVMLDVHEWLPQIPEEENYGPNGVNKRSVAMLFRPECHMYDRVNVCPEEAEAVFENKFSLQSIIGLIEHAGMYSSNIFREEDVSRSYMTCDVGSNSASLLNHTAAFDPPDSNTFVIGFHNLFDCVSGFNYDNSPSYALYSKSTDESIYASLTTRKQHVGTEWYTGIMSDVFQSYIRTDTDGNALMMAYNGASFDEKESGNWGHRGLLIIDMQTMRVALKTMNIDSRGIVLVGGVADDGNGYYMAKTGSFDDGEFYYCVKGYAGESSFVDEAECNQLEGLDRFFEPDNWPADELYAWLGLDDEDSANISGFDSFFSNSNFLSTDMAPQNGVDYFPDLISK